VDSGASVGVLVLATQAAQDLVPAVFDGGLIGGRRRLGRRLFRRRAPDPHVVVVAATRPLRHAPFIGYRVRGLEWVAAELAGPSRYDGLVVAALMPDVQGTIGWIFVGVLALMTAAVGAFSVFLFVQQFRNPGRPERRRP
jgi:hypothetical protein